ncbi:MAG: isochorismatase family protein [Phenylobacterium sp.]|jgi:nicotinamidase-related amidase|uniref:isochorismatase family protein n=1 Tax=Phenylobacterium sp. TaxID=1871053 RepID=UPI0025DDB3CF|nr:isochorismatase family protein [Phenylobacterium sp.]MCA3729094.1 isochorismatase family protein [Phenylobacterium sp.]MCA3733504.1 isochorismatase family protein [Phenylobacterium sp.]
MNSALVIIDMQMVMQERIDSGRDHVNPEAASNIAALVGAFREAGKAVIHVRHQDDELSSPLHPHASGYQPMPCGREFEGEPVFIKKSSSAFATTDLLKYLMAEGVNHLFVTGAVAGFCVNSTVRAGSDLGIDMTVVRDAVLGFDLPGAKLDARTIFDVSMGLLEADFATLSDSKSVIEAQHLAGSVPV